MLSLLRTRRWIGFTALVLGAIVAFGLLSSWQWSRAEQHRNERLAVQAAAAAAPTGLADLDLSGGVTPADEWRTVTVTGVYDTAAEVLVRKRPLEATNGFWVMTPLRAVDGSVADGTLVWVNRGWLPVGGDALATPAVPPPPAGEVTVVGYLRPFEAADPTDNEGLPAGQVAAPAPALLPAAPSVDGYLQLAESVPVQEGLTLLPLPEPDDGRNVSYAVQWLLFAAVAMAGWYVFLRREAREDAAALGADRPAVPAAEREG